MNNAYKKYFCTFASSSMKKSLQRIEKQAKNLNFFDNIFIYNEENLEESFKIKFKDKLKSGIRGYGYWVWKPQVILQTLEKMQYGDILLYTDAGCHFNKNGVDKLFDYFEQTNNSELGIGVTQFVIESKDVSLKNEPHLEKEWTKGDVFDFFNARENEGIYNSGQFQATILFIKKIDKSIDILKQWLSVFENNFNLVDDSVSVSKNFEEFKENRHDQSILSVLLKTQYLKSFCIPASEIQQVNWGLLKNYPILAMRDRGLSYFARIKRKIDYIKNVKKKKIRIMYIVGGLGNQIFQYAFLLNAKSKNFKIEIDYSDLISKTHNGYELGNVFSIGNKNHSTRMILEKFFITGPFFYFKGREINLLRIIKWLFKKIFHKNIIFKSYIEDNRVLMENPFFQPYLDVILSNKKKIYFYGMFQSYKYFEHIKDQVFKVFTFPQIKRDDQNNYTTLQKIKDFESVSFHVRRGDYLDSKWYYLNVCDYLYYKDAFEFLEKKLFSERKIEKNKIKVFVFSDDIEWCKNSFDFLNGYEIIFVDWNKKENSYKDMQLMSECKHNIIPNSTFSWWGAYLNKNPEKIIIAPKYWFKGVRTTEDRVPKDWFLI